MTIIKKNIFLLFYFILILSSIVFCLFIYKISSDAIEDHVIEQTNITNVTANSLNSLFYQYEMILDILGNQLTKNKNYENSANSQEILDSLLKLNPTITAFGLAKPDGELYVISSNLVNENNLKNLTRVEEVEKSFRHTLDKDSMVIGRTYYHEQLKTLIVPIRKAIRDENGKVLSVMTAGINVNKIYALLSNSSYRTVVFRDFDNYTQLSFDKTINNEAYYNVRIPDLYKNSILDDIQKKYQIPIHELKNKETIVSIKQKRFVGGEAISTIKYLKKYELWVLTQTYVEVIDSQIYKKAGSFLFIYIIMMIVIYYLFRNINNYEMKKQQALFYEANHDHLTKLKNRAFLSNVFENIKNKNPFSVLFIDLDNFKNINDNYGHAFGDLILKEVAARLTSFKEQKDILVRYSGDEFLLITYRTDKDNIETLASKILERLAEPYLIEQYQFFLGASIGISQYPTDANSFDEAKRYADIAMYEAKKQKNSFCIFEDAIKHKYLRNSVIEHELKSAIQKNEIFMMYQPQVDNQGKLFGVEALVRWNNENLGFVPPNEFIKVAENSKVILKIGEFIIKTSTSEILEIQRIVNKPFQLSINISVKQFMEVNFYDNLVNLVDKIGFNKLHLTLEVTENVFIEDLNYILGVMDRLKKLNIKISLDDFGTGYSSLSLLRKLPIDELKIDKSFVDDITTDENSLSMATSIISIGKKFNMAILAEGIEKLEQKELLEKYGCDLYQGYYYSKPLKKDDLIKFIEANINDKN